MSPRHAISEVRTEMTDAAALCSAHYAQNIFLLITCGYYMWRADIRQCFVAATLDCLYTMVAVVRGHMTVSTN